VPGSPGQLVVLGGLTPTGTSASGVYALRTATGAARQIGALSARLHDAAGVTSGGRALVFGGGSPVTVGTVQAFSGAGTARVTGSLPAPRSDAAAIISNQEQNETIIKLAYPSGKITWSFGHPGHPGTAPGYLNEPDDAYLLKDRQVTVADAQNCRVLVINANRTVAHQIGTDGVCVHHPPASMGSPNGDTPLADGNLLVSEINGSWVSEYTRRES